MANGAAKPIEIERRDDALDARDEAWIQLFPQRVLLVVIIETNQRLPVISGQLARREFLDLPAVLSF
jgi:hypothetical protein